MAKQFGNSERGPSELDQAERNRAFGGDDEEIDTSDRGEGNTRLAESDDDTGDTKNAEPSQVDVDVDDEAENRYDAAPSYGEPPLDEGEKVGAWDEKEAAHGSEEDGSFGDPDSQTAYSAVPEMEDDDGGAHVGYNADDDAAGGLRADNPEERWEDRWDDVRGRWSSER